MRQLTRPRTEIDSTTQHSRQAEPSILSPAAKVIIAYLLIIVALAVVFSNRVELWWIILLGHAAVISLVLVAARIASRRPHRVTSRANLAAIINGWYPVVLITLTYKELEYLIPRLHPRDYDWPLARIDYRLFGFHPTVWLERLAHPALSETLQLAYSCYYFLPVALGFVLWRSRRFQAFHFFVFILALGFYLSYLGYIIVPAIGPRFVLADLQTTPLTGLLMFEWVRGTLDRAEGITRDCFPSGHTALTLLVLYYARRFSRPLFWVILPVAAAIIAGTVYLRYHYVIDVIAGAMLALLVITLAGSVHKWMGGAILDAESGSGEH